MTEAEEKATEIMLYSAREELKKLLGFEILMAQMEHGFSCLKCRKEVFVIRGLGIVHCGCPPPPFRKIFSYKESE